MRFFTVVTLCASLMLTACADQPVVLDPVSVDVPVAVPCVVRPVSKPDFALAHVSTADPFPIKVKAAFVELDQRKAYEARLGAAIDSCQ